MKKFWVDWDDKAFPRIRPAAEAWENYTDLKSLKACKRDIRTHAREERQHWLAIIHLTDVLTEEKIERDR